MLSGGGAGMPGIRDAFAELTRLPVAEADPFTRMTVGRSIATDGLASVRSKAPVAIGLAVGSVA